MTTQEVEVDKILFRSMRTKHEYDEGNYYSC
jgi:hypothetical protein